MAICNRECQIFSRVVGYLMQTDNWNIGKKSEFEDRVPFDGDKAIERIRLEEDADKAENLVEAENSAQGQEEKAETY